MGKRERMRGTDSVVFGRCTHVREEGRCALCEVTIFSLEGGARRGVFFAPFPRGAPAGARLLPNAYAWRARPPFFDFFLHCFTAWM